MAYNRLTQDFCEFLRSKSLAAVEHFDIRAFLAHLYRRGLSSSSLARQLSGLKTFFDFLNLYGVVSFIAPRFIRTRKVPKRLPRFLTEEQMTKLIEAARTPRDRALLELFYGTGCRLGEIVGIRVEDVEFTERSIRVLGKGNKERIVLFGRPAAKALAEYLGDRQTGYLFEEDKLRQALRVTKAQPNKQTPTLYWRASWNDYSSGTGEHRWKWLGKVAELSRAEAQAKLRELLRSVNPVRPKGSRPLYSRTVYRVVRSTALRAGLGKVHPHMIRHSFATHLLNRGADLRCIQELLGHSSISSTQIYTWVSMPQLAETLKRCHPHG